MYIHLQKFVEEKVAEAKKANREVSTISWMLLGCHFTFVLAKVFYNFFLHRQGEPGRKHWKK